MALSVRNIIDSYMVIWQYVVESPKMRHLRGDDYDFLRRMVMNQQPTKQFLVLSS